MKSIVRPSSCCRRFSSSRIEAWIETSRAGTGSSATSRVGLDRQGAGDPDPLALTAGEGERTLVEGALRHPHHLEQLGGAGESALLVPADAVDPQQFGQVAPTVIRGLSEE